MPRGDVGAESLTSDVAEGLDLESAPMPAKSGARHRAILENAAMSTKSDVAETDERGSIRRAAPPTPPQLQAAGHPMSLQSDAAADDQPPIVITTNQGGEAMPAHADGCTPGEMVVKVKCPGCTRCLALAGAVMSRDLTVVRSTSQSIVYQCASCGQCFETPVYIDKKFLVVKGIRKKLRAYRNRHENARIHYSGYYNAMMLPSVFLSATLSILAAYGGEEEENEGTNWFWWRKMATTGGNALNTILIALIALFKFQGLMEQHGQAAKMYDSLLVELEYKVEHRLSFVKHAGTPLDLAEYSKIDVAIAEFLKYAESRIAEIDGNTPVVPEHLKEGHEPTGQSSISCCLLRALGCLLPMLVDTFFMILRLSFGVVTVYLGYRIYKDIAWEHGELHGLRWYHSMIFVTALLIPAFIKYFLYIWQIAMMCVASLFAFHILVDLKWDKYPDFRAMGLQWFHFMVAPAIVAAFNVPQYIRQHEKDFIDLDHYLHSLHGLIGATLKPAPRDIEHGARGYVDSAPTLDASGDIIIVGRPCLATDRGDESAPLLALAEPMPEKASEGAIVPYYPAVSGRTGVF